jgi:hypothetical protein
LGKSTLRQALFAYLNANWLFTVYDKNEAVDLATEEKKILKQAI